MGRGFQFAQKKCGNRGFEGGPESEQGTDGSYFGIMIPDASCERRVFHASFRAISDGCNRLVASECNMIFYVVTLWRKSLMYGNTTRTY